MAQPIIINIKYLVKSIKIKSKEDADNLALRVTEALVKATESIQESLKSDSDKSEQQSANQEELK